MGLHRLSPEMVSTKLLALHFVRRYWRCYRASPSYGEIAAGLSVSRPHAFRLVRQLAAEGQLIVAGGRRGICLPDRRARALAELRRAGWVADAQVTSGQLPRLPVLDYLPDHAKGENAAAHRPNAHNDRGAAG